MTHPSAFEIGRTIGNNFAQSARRVNDENSIEKILSESLASGNPEVIQNNIGKILSQVSPERQGVAVQYLQNAYQNVKEKQLRERQRTAAQQAGIDPDLPEALQTKQFESTLDQQKFNRIVGGQPQASPNASTVDKPAGGAPPIEAQTPQTSQGIQFKDLSDEQLVQLRGIKSFEKQADSELKRRQEDNKIQQKRLSDVFKSQMDRSNKILERADEIAETLPQKNTALNLMEDAIANKNLSYFSKDNLAEITGIEGLRSPEGAIFKTAGKEYFLGSISRAGARPNQWIEQQISDMMTKIGRSTEANLSVARALRNELDIDTERVRLTEEISNKLLSEGDHSLSTLPTQLNRELSRFAEKKQLELFNDLRAIKSIADKTEEKFRKVEKGTPISPVMAQALLQRFNNDPARSAQEASKLGYTF